jgi:hypothetical protein
VRELKFVVESVSFPIEKLKSRQFCDSLAHRWRSPLFKQMIPTTTSDYLFHWAKRKCSNSRIRIRPSKIFRLSATSSPACATSGSIQGSDLRNAGKQKLWKGCLGSHNDSPAKEKRILRFLSLVNNSKMITSRMNGSQKRYWKAK